MRQGRVAPVLSLVCASICALMSPPAWGAPAVEAAPRARLAAAGTTWALSATGAVPPAGPAAAASTAAPAAAAPPAAGGFPRAAARAATASRTRPIAPDAADTPRAAGRPSPAPQPSSGAEPAPEASAIATTHASPAAAAAGSLDAVIARIPSYTPGAARWVRRSYQGHLGAADWYTGTIYISPAVPPRRLYSVAVHEWSHLLQVRVYGGSVERTIRELNAAFGGSGMTGAERAADCMAVLQGARWTHYTACSDVRWRAAAARLLGGRPA